MWPEISDGKCVVALVGNPNVGKSTLFNSLTGAKQHTGNWPGKTVEVAYGEYEYKGKDYILFDLPGTYSLCSNSAEEEEAIHFLESGQVDCVVIVGDATCLERNLCLALQVIQVSSKPIFCVNLMDEARRKHVDLDLILLERRLGIPVVGTAASSKTGLEDLKEIIRNTTDGYSVSRPLSIEKTEIEKTASEIYRETVRIDGKMYESCDRFILGKWTGYLLVMGLLLLIFYLTISGANYISSILETVFTFIGDQLYGLFRGLPSWLISLLMDGVYETVSCVMSVMIPPILIFYPLFSFLEELGYLPRVAFLMDHAFSKCGGCGKQALTTMMGFGCNTVGVLGCRIISSPKERLIAILTNSIVPCNGRFPTILILISMICHDNTVLSVLLLCGYLGVSVGATMIISKKLDHILPSEQKPCFYLELPPYRLPKIRCILTRTLFDKIGYIIGRTAAVSVPIGVLIWLLCQYKIAGKPILLVFAEYLDPIGLLMGMNGIILLSFILSFPANELLLPLIAVSVRSAAFVSENSGIAEVLQHAGITWKIAICMLFFILFHWPCATTCMTIHKETKSWKWTIAAMLLPSIIGILGCILLSIILNGSFIP